MSHRSSKKYCDACRIWMAKTQYYDHIPCKDSSRDHVRKGGSEITKIGGKYYCDHCKKAVSKSTFYEHRVLYGGSKGMQDKSLDCAFQIPAENSANLEILNAASFDCDEDENLTGADLDLEDEDLQFFSEAGDSDGESNDDSPPEVT